MTTIAKRCLEMQRLIQAAKTAGQPVPEFVEELAGMEAELRGRGEWRDEHAEPGAKCPWPSCRCTHIGCSGGFLNELRAAVTPAGNRSLAAAFRCPTCDQARPAPAQSRRKELTR